ncbi:MAG: hypothetical protein K0S16_1944 [Moraxellaceae bacterium]|nr:hypothetical protein [Moraxellaceae bacterium]
MGLLMFGLVFFALWIDEYGRYKKNMPIEEAPAYTIAWLDGFSRVESGKSRRVSVILKYKFRVNGRDYHGNTAAMEKDQAINFLSRGPIEVVYSARDPHHNTVKSYFRPGQTKREFYQSFLLAGLVAGAVGLVLGLLTLLTQKLWRWTAAKSARNAAARVKARAAVPPPKPEVSAERARLGALMRAVEEKKKADPLAGAKMGAVEINQDLLKTFKSGQGTDMASLLCALGALAGYACQASLRNEALIRGESVNAPFALVKDAYGRTYYCGEALDRRLAEERLSVWNIATTSLRKAGSPAPDIAGIFTHVAASVGSEQFGVPRWPEGHAASDLPLHFLKTLWPVVLPKVKQFAHKPEEWPVLFGCALHEMVQRAKGVMAPELALTLAMESAIPMSRIDFLAMQQR